MNINRRGLFALGGGAVVAGPSIASNMAQGMAQASSPMMDYARKAAYGGMDAATSPVDDATWVMRQAANLRKTINGERSKEELQQDEYQRIHDQTRTHWNVECLRSVAPGHKAVMVQEQAKARYSEANKRQATWTLESLQEQYPLLNLLG